jgi:hypothetical protein
MIAPEVFAQGTLVVLQQLTKFSNCSICAA